MTRPTARSYAAVPRRPVSGEHALVNAVYAALARRALTRPQRPSALRRAELAATPPGPHCVCEMRGCGYCTTSLYGMGFESADKSEGGAG